MSKKEERKLVYMSSSLVDAAIAASRKLSTSLSKFVEDSVRVSLTIVEELGLSLDYARELLSSLRSIKALGGFFIPRSVAEYIEKNTSHSREELLKRWYESGKLYGIYFRESSDDKLKTIKVFLEVTRPDLSEVAIIKQGDQAFVLKCVSASMSLFETENLAAFVKGFLESLGFTVISLEHAEGIVIVKFMKA